MNCGCVSHMECGLQDEHCTEGELTKSPCTDVSEDWGLSLGIRHSPVKAGRRASCFAFVFQIGAGIKKQGREL